MDRPQPHVEAPERSEPLDEVLASLASERVDLTDQLLDQSVLQALFGGSGAEVRVGRYTILGRIGSGASGVVYDARDSELDRRVAIKAVTLSTGMSDAELQRMRREAPLLAQLTHPNVVAVYDVLIRRDALYVVMEKIDGDTLDRWLQRPGRTWTETLDVFRQVARGLAAAHAAGIVHRDVKPANIRMDADRRVRLLDFGLAKELTASTSGDGSLDPARSGSGSADASAALGTPAYVAPEQAAAQVASPAADQYSFCVSLYEALHGCFPAAGSGPSPLKSGASRVPNVPRWVDAALARGLSVAPEARFPSMHALERALDPRRRRRRRVRRWLAVGGLALAVTAVGSSVAGHFAVDDCQVPVGTGAAYWSEPRRDAVHHAVLGSGRSHAPETSTRVLDALDRYIEGWSGAYAAVCDDEESPARERARRRSCLERAHVSLQQSVEILSRTDGAIADRAVMLVRELPSPSGCLGGERSGGAALEPEPPPGLEAPVAEVRDALARARALCAARQTDEALALAREAEDDARALGFRPLLADASYIVGATLHQAGRFDEATQHFEESYFIALDVEYMPQAAKSAYSLGDMNNAIVRNARDARRWLRRSQSATERGGSDPAEVAKGLILEAVIIQGHGWSPREPERLAMAGTLIDRALSLLEAQSEADPIDIARALSTKAHVLVDQGDNEPAIAAARRSVDLSTLALGPLHPLTIRYRVGLGGLLEGIGDLPEAARVLHEVASLDATDGTLPSLFAQARYSLAAVYRQQGDFEAALAEARAADALVVRFLGEEFVPRAQLLATISHALIELERSEEALEVAMQALALKHRLEASPTAVSTIHQTMAYALKAVGQRAEALKHIETSLALTEKEHGAESSEVVFDLSLRGDIRLEMGDPAGALEDFRRADALLVRHGRVNELGRLFILYQLASALLELDGAAEAIEAMERGYAIWEGTGMSPKRKAWAKFELAKALWSVPAERERAVAVAREAHGLDVEAGDVATDHRAEVEAWLERHADRGAGGPRALKHSSTLSPRSSGDGVVAPRPSP